MVEYGLQLYSVKDGLLEDYAGTLKKIAEMGYSSVEICNLYGHSAEDVRAMLDEYGLTCIGTHTYINVPEEDFAACVKMHKTLGCTNFISPVCNVGTKEELDNIIKRLNALEPKLAAEGITLVYHNHETEFRPNKDGQIPHTELEKRTNVRFEIDTFLTYRAHQDPIETMIRLKDRTPMIHVRDGLLSGEERALGEGEAPIASVKQTAEKLGMYMIVESAGYNPTGLCEVERCIKYLKSLDK